MYKIIISKSVIICKRSFLSGDNYIVFISKIGCNVAFFQKPEQVFGLPFCNCGQAVAAGARVFYAAYALP